MFTQYAKIYLNTLVIYIVREMTHITYTLYLIIVYYNFIV